MKTTYIKSSIFVLGLLLLGAIFFEEDISIAVNGVASGERKIPIYCVDTDEKKVALSFDAAWGDARYGLFCCC